MRDEPISLDSREKCIKCGGTLFWPENMLGERNSHVYRCYNCENVFSYGQLAAHAAANKSKQVLDLIQNNIEDPFEDQHGRFFCYTPVDQPCDHLELLPIDSKDFRFWVINLWDKTHGDVLGKDTIANAKEALKAKIHQSKNSATTHIRSYYEESSRTLYYDPLSSDWKVIAITHEGWKLSTSREPHFVREKHMLPQVMPSETYSDNILDQFLDLFHLKGQSTRLLLKVYLISLFIPDFPHPLFVVHGDHGALKTFIMKKLKDIVDPSSVLLLDLPDDKKELMLTFVHNYIIFLDNLSRITKDQSDDLCRAVTGEGRMYRELYSDDDMRSYSYIKSIGMNGINNPAFSPDLLDRVFSLELERIPDEKRLREVEVDRIMAILKPQMLGYIFDVLVKVLKIVDQIQVHKKHRLADYLQWGEAISLSMGYGVGEFVSAYSQNAVLQIQTAIESNFVALLLVKFVESMKENELEFSPELLHSRLQEFALAANIQYKAKQFPASAAPLGKKLRELKATLMQYGIEVEFGKGKSRVIKVRKLYTLSAFESVDESKKQ